MNRFVSFYSCLSYTMESKIWWVWCKLQVELSFSSCRLWCNLCWLMHAWLWEGKKCSLTIHSINWVMHQSLFVGLKQKPSPKTFGHALFSSHLPCPEVRTCFSTIGRCMMDLYKFRMPLTECKQELALHFITQVRGGGAAVVGAWPFELASLLSVPPSTHIIPFI